MQSSNTFAITLAQLQQQIANQQKQYQQSTELQNQKLDAIVGEMSQLKVAIAEFIAANRSSSSSSGTRYNCPMGCGSSFKKVDHRC